MTQLQLTEGRPLVSGAEAEGAHLRLRSHGCHDSGFLWSTFGLRLGIWSAHVYQFSANLIQAMNQAVGLAGSPFSLVIRGHGRALTSLLKRNGHTASGFFFELASAADQFRKGGIVKASVRSAFFGGTWDLGGCCCGAHHPGEERTLKPRAILERLTSNRQEAGSVKQGKIGP